RQTRLGALLLGGTSLHVVQEVAVPVWVVRPAEGGLGRIMVATDFSPVCDELLERAAQLATLFGAELHLAHVVERQPRGFWHFAKESPRSDEEHRRMVEEAHTKLGEAAARLALTNIPTAPQLHLREGVVEEELQELVSSHDIDLLAMGLVAWGGLQGLLLGSTAQALLPQLKCSLLTMRGKK